MNNLVEQLEAIRSRSIEWQKLGNANSQKETELQHDVVFLLRLVDVMESKLGKVWALTQDFADKSTALSKEQVLKQGQFQGWSDRP